MVDSYVKVNDPVTGLPLSPAIDPPGIAIGSIIPGDMSDPYPAVDATNGPLTADSGLTFGNTTMPAPAGKTLYRWNSGVFRTQGMSWEAANTSANTTGQSLAINNSTPRKWTYGTSSGFPYESNHDFAFVTDSTTVTYVYWLWTGYTGSNYHDARFFCEHFGRMKSLRDGVGAATATAMPKTSTGGGGWYSQTFTFKDSREKQHRAMLPMNAYVLGVYIDATATIRKAPNVPFFLYNGDSWGEPAGNAGTITGAAYPAGTYRTMGLAQELAVCMGVVVGLMAEGGTGEYNVNDSAAHDANFTSAVGESVFHGVARINDAWTKFGAGSPIILTPGGWNDNNLPGTSATARAAYATRLTEGIDRWRNKKADIKLIYTSLQPVDIAGTGGTGVLTPERAASALGQKDAWAARPANVIGGIDLLPMWPNMSTAGQRGPNCNTTDYIHLNAKGAESTARYIRADIVRMVIPQAYYNAQLAAA